MIVQNLDDISHLCKVVESVFEGIFEISCDLAFDESADTALLFHAFRE